MTAGPAVRHLPCDLPSGTRSRRVRRTTVRLLAGFVPGALAAWILWRSGVRGAGLNLFILSFAGATLALSFRAWRRDRAVVSLLPDRVRLVGPTGVVQEVALAEVVRLWHRHTAFDLHAATGVASFQLDPAAVEDTLDYLIERLEAASPGCAFDLPGAESGGPAGYRTTAQT